VFSLHISPSLSVLFRLKTSVFSRRAPPVFPFLADNVSLHGLQSRNEVAASSLCLRPCSCPAFFFFFSASSPALRESYFLPSPFSYLSIVPFFFTHFPFPTRSSIFCDHSFFLVVGPPFPSARFFFSYSPTPLARSLNARSRMVPPSPSLYPLFPHLYRLIQGLSLSWLPHPPVFSCPLLPLLVFFHLQCGRPYLLRFFCASPSTRWHRFPHRRSCLFLLTLAALSPLGYVVTFSLGVA